VEVDVVMPRLSDSMEEGTVVQWLVEVGQSVEPGQPLVEIDTDKATMEYEAETAGAILELLVQEGQSAPIGTPIARLGVSGDGAPPAAPAGASRVNASPVARRLATELGVDLGSLEGSGPGGQVTKEDVQRAAGASGPEVAAPPGVKGEVRLEQPTRLQQAIARHMVEGASAPVFAVEVEIDMGAVVALRADLSAQGAAPSLNDFVVKAAAVALREFPRLNASYTDSGFELYSRVNVGIAVAAEDALVVPTIFDADRKPISDISAESQALAAKVREATVTPAELDGGTFTVTNLGMFGISRLLPIINPPQAAILAVGAVTRRPVIDEDGNVVAREVMNATLVCDHRIVYGADGGRFLARLRGLLEQPAELASS
jgi:pyruvate dehydrogenase E2 component (dihydrolipoamide acetyltransferase)